jgi:hypothetical protein
VRFPRVLTCLLCEGVRPEQFGKTIILGFCGVLPAVKIIVYDFAQPVPLTFYLLGEALEEGGSFRLAPAILDSKGTSVPGKDPSEMTVKVEPIGFLQLIMSFPGIKYPGPGVYTFRLHVNGKQEYENTFELIQDDPARPVVGSPAAQRIAPG